MQKRATKRAALTVVLLSAALVAGPLGQGTTATAATTSAPVGNIGKFTQTFREDFRTTAAAKGKFAKSYAKSWQPYPDGTGGMYYSGTQISAINGTMDVRLDGKRGAAGTFGSPTGAWGHKGGKFTVRAMAAGGNGNGAAFMLWPSSDTWSDGEIDYPESNFETAPMLHHHSMTPGREATATSLSTGTTWRSWHTYSIEWIPGKSVSYSLDGKVIKTVTKDVPTTAHRYMFQVGNWGGVGHLYIDWVTTYSYTG
ncbi:glycoside hydrolase family 16 protein [Curtobacterium flaccumfaciens pv. oortii]|uniref:glycoside hydrolase family 16 protein n=1 Tax=Curtobacterium flaccumfaciens TaxID=2035 RepID=UPI00196807E1|nr:glycoside hydrolase family 16 protein [Curtobacterium flaccumfaciens]MBT1621598.1 glycoside hydrolase family 16 protein [Curtobacterium flaccumfaciens pv. oortii]QSB22738.1 glycoside hydrolase family 16 protein [Curtobacterium sp. 24E2]